MKAPTAKVAKLDPAAPQGDPRSSGSSPSSSRTSVSRACSGFLSSSAAVRAAWSADSPFCWKMSASSAASSCGASGQLAPLQVHLAGQDVALRGHRGELAHRHGEGPGEQPGEAGDHEAVGVGARAGHAEHEREVGEEPVVHAEDGGAERPAPSPAVPPLARGDGSARLETACAAEAGQDLLVGALLLGHGRGVGAPLLRVLVGVAGLVGDDVGDDRVAPQPPGQPEQRADAGRGAVGRDGDARLLELVRQTSAWRRSPWASSAKLLPGRRSSPRRRAPRRGPRRPARPVGSGARRPFGVPWRGNVARPGGFRVET